MTELGPGVVPTSAPHPKPHHVAAVVAGNALQFYDFLTYAFFAAQIGRTFFPNANAGTSLLASLATFGAGFLMRPVGAFVIGRLADRVGRKPAMLLSFALMGVAMCGLALTPSFGMIGPLAPALAVFWRLAQGFALGGEVGPSTAYMVEAAPPHRRGFYVALQYAGQDAAILASGAVGYVISSHISPGALDAWGWRVAFLLGAVIIPFGLALRSGLAETLDAPVPADDPAVSSQRPFALLVVLGLVLLAGGTTVNYVLTYLTTYSTVTLHMATKVGFIAPIVMGVCGLVFDPLGGWLSDRFGRKPVMLWPWIVLLLTTLPAFYMLSQLRTAGALIGATAVMQIAAGVSTSATLVALTEGLPKRIRSGSLGLIYAFAISVFGGSAQFTVAWLTQVTGDPLAPAWYTTAGVAIALVAMLLLPETSPRRPRKAA